MKERLPPLRPEPDRHHLAPVALLFSIITTITILLLYWWPSSAVTAVLRTMRARALCDAGWRACSHDLAYTRKLDVLSSLVANVCVCLSANVSVYANVSSHGRNHAGERANEVVMGR